MERFGNTHSDWHNDTLFSEWNEENGVNSNVEGLRKFIDGDPFVTLKENYDMFNTPDSQNSQMNQCVALFYKTLEFFISQGKYAEADKAKFLADGIFDSSIIDSLYKK